MANGRFGGGNGSKNSPYLIEDAADLNRIRFNLTSSYKLVNNINLDVYPFNVNNGWSPIAGTFLGVLDGNGKKIQNLYINRGLEDNVGFFRTIANSATLNSSIIDVAFENAKVIGRNYVGILAGQLNYGGPAITEYQSNSNVFRCTFDGEVTGETNVGLVAGYMLNNTSGTAHNWRALTNVKVSGSLIAKIIGSYYGAVIGQTNATHLTEFKNIVVDADFKRLIGAPIGHSITQFSVTTNYRCANIFFNATKWSGSTTAVTNSSIAITDAEMRRPSRFEAISGEYLNYHGKYTPVWILETGNVPFLYNKNVNNYFILNNGNYYNLANGNWNLVFEGFTPTREQATKEGIKHLSLVSQVLWDKLKEFEGKVELVNIVETSSGVKLSEVQVPLVPITEKHTPTRKFFSKKINFSDFGQAISEIKTI